MTKVDLRHRKHQDFQWHGLVSYQRGLDLQAAAWEHIQKNPEESIILGLEHHEVITLGNRGSRDQDLNAEFYSANATPSFVSFPKFEIFEVDRGGQATLHSPGQLVIYPILSLKHRNLGVRNYVQLLEKTTSDLLQSLGIATMSAQGAGLQTDKGKIAFIGLRVDRGVTRHGLSLNISNELSHFALIRPCGVTNQKMDRVLDWGPELNLKDFFEEWGKRWSSLQDSNL